MWKGEDTTLRILNKTREHFPQNQDRKHNTNRNESNKLTKYFKSSKDDADKMTTNQTTIDAENVNESSETIIEITTDKPFHPPATYPFPKKKYGTRE